MADNNTTVLSESNLFGVTQEVDTKYSTKIQVPQYLPKADCPKINELCDTYKYDKMISEINGSNLPEEQKAFLRLAAARHIVFNYSKIADYYAHQPEEMQKLMENSALVIIDLDDAIANGYVKLNDRLNTIKHNNFNSTD